MPGTAYRMRVAIGQVFSCRCNNKEILMFALISQGIRPIVFVAAVSLCAQAALADSRFFDSLPGQSASEAMSGLSMRGYQSVGTEEEHGQTLHYLFNSQTEDCEVLATRDGWVRSVQAVQPQVCDSIRRDASSAPAHGANHGHDRGRLPPEITGLVGNKRNDAEGKLEAQGYAKIEGSKASGRTSSLWWNRSREDCLSVESRDGKVRHIQREHASVCD